MSQSSKQKVKGRSIRQQIITSFVVFALVSLIVVSGVSIGFILWIGNTTTNQSSNALKEQIKTNILTTAEKNGEVVVSKLQKSESKIVMLATQTEEAFSPDATYEYRPSYYNSNETMPPDAVYNSNYGLMVSWNYSNYDFSGATPENYESLITPELNETINNSAQMDYVFKMIHETAPEFRWLYAGFETEGLFRNYPGSLFSGIKDARTRPWYIAAKDAWSMGEEPPVVYTEPYYDASEQTLLISIVKGILDEDGYYLGAVAGDLTVSTIQQKILDIQILESGYAALVQGDDALVVAHPDWEGSPSNETIPYLPEFESLTSNQIAQITSSTSGVIEYQSGGEEWYLAHVSIMDGEYTICVMVPVDEAIESVDVLEARIQDSTMMTIIQVGIIVSVTAILAIVVGIVTSNRITKPIQRLTQIASRMATDTVREDLASGIDIDIDEELEEQDDEIGDLTRAFKGMLNSLQEEAKENQE